MKWYFEVLKKYATFNGRARRKEYWQFILFNFIISIILGIVDSTAGTMVGESGIIGAIYSIAIIIPAIGVGVRRMHDVGKSGWYMLIPFYNLVLACTNGVAGENEYGADPKNQEMDLTDHLVA